MPCFKQLPAKYNHYEKGNIIFKLVVMKKRIRESFRLVFYLDVGVTLLVTRQRQTNGTRDSDNVQSAVRRTM